MYAQSRGTMARCNGVMRRTGTNRRQSTPRACPARPGRAHDLTCPTPALTATMRSCARPALWPGLAAWPQRDAGPQPPRAPPKKEGRVGHGLLCFRLLSAGKGRAEMHAFGSSVARKARR